MMEASDTACERIRESNKHKQPWENEGPLQKHETKKWEEVNICNINEKNPSNAIKAREKGKDLCKTKRILQKIQPKR